MSIFIAYRIWSLPFHSQDIFGNSPYCVLYNSGDVSYEKFDIGSINNPLIDIFLYSHQFIVCLILYWYCKEEFCPGHSLVKSLTFSHLL